MSNDYKVQVQLPKKSDDDRKVSTFKIMVDDTVWYEHDYAYQTGICLTAKFAIREGDGRLTVDFAEG